MKSFGAILHHLMSQTSLCGTHSRMLDPTCLLNLEECFSSVWQRLHPATTVDSRLVEMSDTPNLLGFQLVCLISIRV